MELLVMCFVVAALVQHAAKDAFAGVTGRTFPSQAYRMKRLELRAARRAASDQTAARRSPAREYFAGLWALAWDTQARRLERWGQERQDRWERRHAGEVVDSGRRPAREFVRVWWHTGPSQRWANAWQQASDKRRQKLEAANEPADRQPDAPTTPAPRTPAPQPVVPAEPVAGSDDRKEPDETADPTPGEPEQAPTHGDRETSGVDAAADQTTNGTNEGTDDVTGTRSSAGRLRACVGAVPTSAQSDQPIWAP